MSFEANHTIHSKTFKHHIARLKKRIIQLFDDNIS